MKKLLRTLLMIVAVICFIFTLAGCGETSHVHEYSEQITNPTCTEKGYTKFYCACGESYVDNYVDELGHDYVYTYNDDATCTQDGTETGRCENGCGMLDTRIKTNTKLNHNFTEPRYVWQGNVCLAEMICQNNSAHNIVESAIAEYVKDTDASCSEPEKGHLEANFTNTVFEKQATATNSEIGSTTPHDYGEFEFEWEGMTCRVFQTCKNNSNHVLYRFVPAATSYVKDADATCDEPEKGRYMATFYDDEYDFPTQYSEQFIVGEKLGHSYSAPVYTWNDTTCTATITCVHDSTHVITETAQGNYVKDTDATCDEPEKGQCKAMFSNSAFAEQTEIVSIGEPLGHDYGEWSSNGNDTHTRVCINNSNHTETKNCSGGTATCFERATCTECNAKHGELLEHNYGAWSSNDNNTHTRVCVNNSNHTETKNCSGGTATCTEKAICKDCNTEYGNSLGHNYGVWNSNGDNTHTRVCVNDSKHTEMKNCSGGTATCDKKAICKDCNAEYGNSLGHNYGAWNSNGNDTHIRVCINDSKHTEMKNCSGGVATCTEKAICQVCNGKYGDFAWHDFAGDFCSACRIEKFSQGLLYELINNETEYSVIGIGVCTDLDIIIPAQYNGKPVTNIGAFSFRNCGLLKSVKIPNSITSIGYFAFEECDSLKSIEIPNSVTSIDDNAFSDCDSLTSITIGEGVKSIGVCAFTCCVALTEINFNAINCEDLSSGESSAVGNGVFINAGIDGVGLNVKFGDKVERVPAYLFYDRFNSLFGTNNIVSVDIGNNVKSIGEFAFYYCKALKSLTIGENVSIIGRGAFNLCTGLTEINFNAVNCADVVSSGYAFTFEHAGEDGDGITLCFGDKVEYIPAYLLCYDYLVHGARPNITTIIISKSIKSIGFNAFYNCPGLIYYKGTAIEWDSVATNNLNRTPRFYYENQLDVPAYNGDYWHYVDGVPTVWVIE